MPRTAPNLGLDPGARATGRKTTKGITVAGVREVRGDQVAQWLTVVAVALFVANGAVLALEAHAYGWATLLFAAAAYVAVSTGIVARPPRRS
jgi:hypothetical protein